MDIDKNESSFYFKRRSRGNQKTPMHLRVYLGNKYNGTKLIKSKLNSNFESNGVANFDLEFDSNSLNSTASVSIDNDLNYGYRINLTNSQRVYDLVIPDRVVRLTTKIYPS